MLIIESRERARRRLVAAAALYLMGGLLSLIAFVLALDAEVLASGALILLAFAFLSASHSLSKSPAIARAADTGLVKASLIIVIFTSMIGSLTGALVMLDDPLRGLLASVAALSVFSHTILIYLQIQAHRSV